MLKSLLAVVLVILSLSLASCTRNTAGFNNYINVAREYEFLYPNGWESVEVNSPSHGVDVVFRDIIEHTTNLSVVISSVPQEKSLASLGTATDVGYQLLKTTLSNSNRQVDLISASTKETVGKIYYLLEYEAKLPNYPQRHNLASVIINRGQLFTFNLSTPQTNWQEFKNQYQIVVNSFQVH